MPSKTNEWNGKSIGQFKVTCGGKCTTSPDYWFTYMTAVLIIVPSFVNIFYV